jgi:hypothetical protein
MPTMKRLIHLSPIVLALLIVSIAEAQTGGGYDLSWSTIDSGGGSSGGSGYTLDGTIGQSDADALNGSGYTLSGGFWYGAQTAAQFKVYLPLVLR